MSMTEVTIEDLSAPSAPVSLPEPVKATSRLKVKTPQPEVTMSSISDLGQVTFSAPKKNIENSEKKEEVEQKKSTKTETKVAEPIGFVDPLTGEVIAPTSVPAGEQESTDDVPPAFDLAASENILTDEKTRLETLASLTLDKDNFVPNLTTILDALAEENEDFQTVVASIDPIFSDIDDDSIKELEKKFRDLATSADKARTKLEKRVDSLLTTFPEGNNWYRMLAAWEVFDKKAYAKLGRQKTWHKKMNQLALDLLGDGTQKEILADFQAGIDLSDSLTNTLETLEKGGLKLTAAQERQFDTIMGPIIHDFVASQPADVPAAKKKAATAKEKTEDPVQELSSVVAINNEYVDNRCAAIDARLDEMQQTLQAFARPDEDRLDSFSRDLSMTAETLDSLTHDLTTTSERLAKLEQATASGIRQLGETSVSSFTKIADQLESKLEKEKQTNSTKQQALKDQIAKNQQDLKLKISALDEAIGTFKKLQSSKDQDQNKKLTSLRDQIESMVKASGKQLETSNSNLSKTRQDLEERLHQFSRQLSEIKNDQIRVDQVQTAALGQLTSQAQAAATQLATITERLEKAETAASSTASEFAALRARYDEQFNTLNSRITNDLETNKSKIDKINAQVAELQAYASRLETENEELRISNAGLKQENWQARRQLGITDNSQPIPMMTTQPMMNQGYGQGYNQMPVTQPLAPAPEIVTVAAPEVAPMPANYAPVAMEQTTVITELPAAPMPEPAPAVGFEAVTAVNQVTPVAPVSPATEPTPVAAQPEPTVSNLEKLGITVKRLLPGTRLLTGRPLDFITLNNQLSTALSGINSFSAWLHQQAAAQAAPVVQSTPISGPTQIPMPEPAPVTAPAPEVPVAPAVETLPVTETFAAPATPGIQPAPPLNVNLPNLQPVDEIPTTQPTDLNRPAYDPKTPIPVPPAPESDVMVLNPNLPVGDTFSAPRPHADSDTVVLPFMS